MYVTIQINVQLNRVRWSSIITKHREWGEVVGETIKEKGDNQTKQQGPPSMLIRRSHNHCLLQLVRHQVKNSLNNLFASLYFPAIGHIVTNIKITNNKGKGFIPYPHTTLSTHAFLDTSVNFSLSYSALQWQEAVVWLSGNKIRLV